MVVLVASDNFGGDKRRHGVLLPDCGPCSRSAVFSEPKMGPPVSGGEQVEEPPEANNGGQP